MYKIRLDGTFLSHVRPTKERCYILSRIYLGWNSELKKKVLLFNLVIWSLKLVIYLFFQSRFQRIIGFCLCISIGVFFFGLSLLYVPVLVLKARKFALMFTIGSCSFLSRYEIYRSELSYDSFWPLSRSMYQHCFA